MAQELLIKQFEKTQNSYLEVKPLKAQVDIKGTIYYYFFFFF